MSKIAGLDINIGNRTIEAWDEYGTILKPQGDSIKTTPDGYSIIYPKSSPGGLLL